MKYNLCSISFRHELVSFRELVTFADDVGFAGIELWGVHARSLVHAHQSSVQEIVEELQVNGMGVSMISDYLDLLAPTAHYDDVQAKCDDLICLARTFGTDKIRIFCGNKGSAEVSTTEWKRTVLRLRELAERTQQAGILLVVETHPDTFADSLASTLQLLADVEHEALRINADFLHLWEAGDDVLAAYEMLRPSVANYHFKNVTDRNALNVFAPGNVYSPHGSRHGISLLSEGQIDFAAILRCLLADDTPYPASIEWFGSRPFESLQRELNWLRAVETEISMSKISN